MITLHQTDRVTYGDNAKPVHVESPDVVINPNYIVAMIERDDWTSIGMVNGDSFAVKESVKEIIEKITHEVDGVYQAFIV